MTATRRLVDALRDPRIVRVAKLILAGLVLAALVRHVESIRAEMAKLQLALRVEPGWLLAGGGLYLLGLSAQGAFFARVVRSSPTPIGPFAAIRAYLVSHLAKYAPGKALVVVVRSALAASAGARPATAAFATLYETLAMMAAGALVAAVAFGMVLPERTIEVALGVALPGATSASTAGLTAYAARGLTVPATALALLLLVPVAPGVFPRLAGLIRRPLRGVGADALPRLSWPLLGEGLAWSALGWTLLGASLVAVIDGINVGSTVDLPLQAADWPLVVAAVALSTVAGFVVPIAPGGLGVREAVLWTILGSIMSPYRAVIAALMLRLVWVGAEVVAAAILLPIRPRARPMTAGVPA